MTAEQVQRILIDLILQLPPSLRPLVGNAAITASGYMNLWVPAVVALLIVAILAIVHITEIGS